MNAETGIYAGKVALITGASRGIGRCLALKLAAQGGSVVVNYRKNAELAEEVVRQARALGGNAIAVQADVEQPEDIVRLFDAVAGEYGRLDYFVNNAAASAFKKIVDLKPHHLDRSYATNVRPFVLGAQEAVKLMDNGGRIVAVSSYGSLRGFATYAALGPNKAAIESFIRFMAVEFAGYGINVNGVNGRSHRVRFARLLLFHSRHGSDAEGAGCHSARQAGDRGRHGERHRVPAFTEFCIYHRAGDRCRRRNDGRGPAVLPRHDGARRSAPASDARLTMAAPRFPHLRAPVTIGTLRLPHRVLMGSMHLNLETSDGPELAAFYAERARGGAGLMVTGGAAVNRAGAGGAGYALINEPEHWDRWRRVVEAVHEAGGLIALQLFHAGRYADESAFGIHPLAPSAVYSTYSKCTPDADDGGADRGDDRGLRVWRRPGDRTRLRRRGDHGLGGLPDQPVRLPGDEPARGRVGWRRRTAARLPDGGDGGGAGGRRLGAAAGADVRRRPRARILHPG